MSKKTFFKVGKMYEIIADTSWPLYMITEKPSKNYICKSDAFVVVDVKKDGYYYVLDILTAGVCVCKIFVFDSSEMLNNWFADTCQTC
jgi:hypothetical protein